MRVSKVGDELVIRLPEAVVEAWGLSEGDDLIVRIEGKQKSDAERQKERDWAIEKLKSFRNTLPRDWKFDREEANAR